MPATLEKSRTTQTRRRRLRKLRSRGIDRRLGRGDWLVQQVKSQNGIQADQQETLATLGLLKIGRCSLFDGDRPEAWGEIAKVQHLVAVRPLTWERPKTKYQIPGVNLMTGLKKPVLYDVDGREARHHEFGGDGFFSVEPYDGSVAINWSTALPIATVLDRLDGSLIDSVKECLVFNPLARKHETLSPETWQQDLRNADFPFVRLETDAVILAWQRPAYPSHVDEDVTAGRIGIICQKVDPATLERLVQSTATPQIGTFAKALVADVKSSAGSNSK